MLLNYCFTRSSFYTFRQTLSMFQPVYLFFDTSEARHLHSKVIINVLLKFYQFAPKSIVSMKFSKIL